MDCCRICQRNVYCIVHIKVYNMYMIVIVCTGRGLWCLHYLVASKLKNRMQDVKHKGVVRQNDNTRKANYEINIRRNLKANYVFSTKWITTDFLNRSSTASVHWTERNHIRVYLFNTRHLLKCMYLKWSNCTRNINKSWVSDFNNYNNNNIIE
jgi:hypothetical protein